MSKPWIHAESSAKRWGGSPSDYIEIHSLFDSSKASFCDARHRCMTHNAWFIGFVLEKVFGVTITNSEGRIISVRDIGEQHVSEDFGGKFIPTVQDYLENMELKEWMFSGKGEPPSSYKMLDKSTTRKTVLDLRQMHID